MRNSRPILAASLAALAAAVVASPAPAAELIAGKPVAFDGYKYGGMLPVGSEKNVDAMRLLIKAADAMGSLRDNGPVPISYPGGPPPAANFLVLGDTTLGLRFDADGTWEGQKAHVVMDFDYGYPGIRIDVKSADGKTRNIYVASNKSAWDDKTPGVYAAPAKTSAAERLIVSFLMPSQVILEARDAANVMKASKVAGRDTLTIPMPFLGADVNLVATLDGDGHPIHSEIAYNGHKYTGDFDEFIADRMDMAVNFSHHIVLQVDGKETANLELNWHQSNPYLIFPVPAEVAAK